MPYRLPPEILAKVMSPALLVYMDSVRHNIDTILSHTGKDRWRPHLKTTKIPQVWEELILRGVTRAKCATLLEAKTYLELLDEKMVEGGDLLLAMPLVEPALTQLGHLAQRHSKHKVSVLCEDPEVIASVPASISVMIDINPGYHRTGVPSTDISVIEELAMRCGSRFRGLHWYEGHLHDLDQEKRKSACFQGYEHLLSIRAKLLAKSIPVHEIVTSGTPGFLSALDFKPFLELHSTKHRVSPGTGSYTLTTALAFAILFFVSKVQCKTNMCRNATDTLI